MALLLSRKLQPNILGHESGLIPTIQFSYCIPEQSYTHSAPITGVDVRVGVIVLVGLLVGVLVKEGVGLLLPKLHKFEVSGCSKDVPPNR